MIDPDLTKAFFLESDSEQLRKIHRWARSRQTAPWPLFGAVLLRVAASTPANVLLPPVIGDYVSLNVFAAFVSASGGGKGKSDSVSKRAWPADIAVVKPGSGEGLAEMFVERKDKPRLHAAILTANEIDAMAGLASRQGSILMPEIKSAWMGEPLGQRNAGAATSRHVKEHDYRLCLSVGVQFGHGRVIFADTSGGAPQRFLWYLTTDPDMPEGTGIDPEPLDISLPDWKAGPNGVVEIVYEPPEIVDTIRKNDLARNRGEGEALDGHAILSRCKVAALLAIMHQRQTVTAMDWELSQFVMHVSDMTRNTMLEYDRQAARAKIRERAVARATGEEFYENSRALTVRNSLLRMLERDGEQSGSDLRRRLGTREKRDLFDRVISSLTSEGLVVETPGEQRGSRYSLSGHGDQGGHPPYPQVNGGDQGGHGDRPATVTDLDSRRSHDADRPKLSCRKWFRNHIAGLREAGHTTVSAFAVYEAGRAEGYSQEAMRQAASNHPDIEVIDRTGGRITWSILPEEATS